MSTKVRLEETTKALAKFMSESQSKRMKRLMNVVLVEIALVGGIVYFGTFATGTGYISLALGLIALALVGLIFKGDPDASTSKEYNNWKSAANDYLTEAGVDTATLTPSLDSSYILYQSYEYGTDIFYPGEIYDGFGNVNGEYTELELRLGANNSYFLMSAGKEIKPQA